MKLTSKSSFTIESKHFENKAVSFAKEELEKYLKKSLGIKAATKQEKSLRFELKLKEKTSEWDSFKCEIKSNSILLTGSNGRSVLYAVYAFLKKYLNFRCYAPGPNGEYCTESKELILPQETFSEKASLKYRAHCIDSTSKSFTPDNIGSYVDCLFKNNANYLLVSNCFWNSLKNKLLPELEKRDIILELGHHGFDFFVPAAKYFDKHPEWFAMLNGKRTKPELHGLMPIGAQICISNEDVRKEYVKNLKKYIKANPYAKVFGIHPNDSSGWCECKKCIEIEKELKQNKIYHTNIASNRYHYFFDKVCEDLKETLRKDKRLSFWAYCAILTPPEKLTADPEKTILSAYPFYRRSYDENIYRAPQEKTEQEKACTPNIKSMDFEFLPGKSSNAAYIKTLKSWKKHYRGAIIAYEYYAKYAWHSYPKIMPHLIAGEILDAVKFGLSGLISFGEFPNWIVYELNHFTFLAFSWNAGRDIDALLEDYIRNRYRESHSNMRIFFSKLESIMNPIGKPCNIFPKDMNSFIKAFEECLSLAKKSIAQVKEKREKKLLEQWEINLSYLIMNLKAFRELFEAEKIYFRKPGSDGKKSSLKKLESFIKGTKKSVDYGVKNGGHGAILSQNLENFFGECIKRAGNLIARIKENDSIDHESFQKVVVRYF